MSGYLPDDFIDSLRGQTDIVEVIGQYVSLKKRGRNWVGLCPFHSERTPSFTVTPSKDMFKCFGCGKAGDVYTFLMEHQNQTFMQAVRMLADRLGVPLPETMNDGGERDEARERLFYANTWAAEFFHNGLVSESGGRRALEYLEKRGLGRELIEECGLGWSPGDGEALKRAALGHGIAESDLVDAGLLYAAEEGSPSRDRFRARVMFPISDTRGRTVGFGGRVLDDTEPKYLNTPETRLFRKGEVLYGLDRARGTIAKESKALVVEGYMDLLSLAQHGVNNAVAPLGTALTAEQARLLGRYAREVFLLYDADSAGLKATFRGGDELLEAGVNVRVATLPGGLDPDDFIRRKGAEQFAALLAAAPDYLDRKIEILTERLNLELVSQRELAAGKLLESVARCRDNLVRSLYLKKTAEFVGVPETVISERLGRIQSVRDARSARERSRGSRSGERAESRMRPGEYFLLALFYHHPEFLDRAREKLGGSYLRDKHACRVHAAMSEASGRGVRNMREALYGSLPEELYPLINRLQAEEANLGPADQVFERCWRELRLEQLELEMKEIYSSMSDKSDTDYNDRLRELQKQKIELQKNLRSAPFFPKI